MIAVNPCRLVRHAIKLCLFKCPLFSEVIMDDTLIVEQVEKFRLLYDKSDKNFKNKIQRENAWSTIGIILDQPAKTCLQRWTVLRTKYNQCKRDYKYPHQAAMLKRQT